jgi:hypothetical protein
MPHLPEVVSLLIFLTRRTLRLVINWDIHTPHTYPDPNDQMHALTLTDPARPITDANSTTSVAKSYMLLNVRTVAAYTRPDQTRPDQTRSDQTRSDQTRSDQIKQNPGNPLQTLTLPLQL